MNQKDYRENEGQLNSIFQPIDDHALFLIDNGGKILTWNSGAEKIYGYSADEVIDKNYSMLFTKTEISNKTPQRLLINAINKEKLSDELKNLRKDGNEFKVKITLSGYKKELNIHLGFIVASHDLSTKIEKSDQINFFATVFQDSNDAIIFQDFEGNIFDWNKGAEKIYGWKKEEVLSMKSWDLVYPEKRDELLKIIKEIKNGKVIKSFETERLKKDNSTIIVWATVTLIKDRDGNSVGISTTERDITNQKKTIELFRSAQKIAKLGSWEANHKTGKLTWSDEVYRIFGFEPQAFEATYEAFINIVHPDDRELVDKSYNAALRKEAVYDVEHRIVLESSEMKFAHSKGEILFDKNDKPIISIGTVQDITEKKIHLQEIKELNETLEQRVNERTKLLEESNKELEAFSYSVSHDLRAPLRHIGGFLNLLKSNLAGELSEQNERYLTKVIQSSEKLGDLIDDLLAYSRIGRKKISRTKCDVSSLVKEIIDEISNEINESNVKWELGSLPYTNADYELLRLVLVNLISNAVKYSSTKENPVIRINSYKKGKKIIYYVKDNGVGFDMKYQGKLFNVFQRLHNEDEFEGTGIGLANVKKIINMHEGKVWAEGKVGEGSTFYFYLS